MVSEDVSLKAGAVPNYTVEYSQQGTARYECQEGYGRYQNDLGLNLCA